jgi:hypothetical protein
MLIRGFFLFPQFSNFVGAGLVPALGDHKGRPYEGNKNEFQK